MRTMTTVLSIVRGSSIGFKATSLRISLQLTQQELADMVGVSKDDVDLFEHNLPMPLETRDKLLKGLFAKKSRAERANISSGPELLAINPNLLFDW